MDIILRSKENPRCSPAAHWKGTGKEKHKFLKVKVIINAFFFNYQTHLYRSHDPKVTGTLPCHALQWASLLNLIIIIGEFLQVPRSGAFSSWKHAMEEQQRNKESNPDFPTTKCISLLHVFKNQIEFLPAVKGKKRHTLAKIMFFLMIGINRPKKNTSIHVF